MALVGTKRDKGRCRKAGEEATVRVQARDNGLGRGRGIEKWLDSRGGKGGTDGIREGGDIKEPLIHSVFEYLLWARGCAGNTVVGGTCIDPATWGLPPWSIRGQSP